MTSESAFLLVAVAVLISSLALAVNAYAAVSLYRAFRRLEASVTPLLPQVSSTLERADTTLNEASVQIRDLSAQARTVLTSAQKQLDAFESAREEIATRLRVQSERLELVLDDTLSRFQEIVGVIHSGVMTPVREVSGVLAGIRVAFQTFLRSRRPSVDRATHDEEMFI